MRSTCSGAYGNSVAAARASAQASAADLAVLDLSLHSELAMDYFTLRSEDAQQVLLDQTVAAYAAALQLAQNLYDGGAAPLSDVAQAQAQLETARTQDEDIRCDALKPSTPSPCCGSAGVALSLEPTPLPLEVLHHRSTRSAVGSAGAAARCCGRRTSCCLRQREYRCSAGGLFPVFNLAAVVGFESTNTSTWIDAPSALWALDRGPLLTVFDGGRRHAQTDQARAAYDEQVANYRTTVTVAYSDVEDWLVALRQLERENTSESAAVAATRTELEQANYRYKAGAATYLEVVVAENASLAAQLSAADIQVRRMNASVLLVKALGGGWEGGMGADQVAGR